MIVRVDPNLYESDDGYSVEWLGREGAFYSEGLHTMSIYTEYSMPDGIAIWASTIHSWRPPHDKEPLTPEDKARIIKNLCRVVEFLGSTPVVIDPGSGSSRVDTR